MWVRKKENEINEAIRIKKIKRFNPLIPLILSIFFAFFSVLYELDFSPFFFFLIGSFIIIYAGQVFFNNIGFFFSWFVGSPSDQDSFDICSSCFTIKPTITEKACSCGGEFEPIEFYDWIEETCD